MAGGALPRLRSQLKSAPPAPWGLVVRDAGSDRDRADIDVTVIDQPAFFASVVVTAAGKGGGHAAIEAPNGRPLSPRAPGDIAAPL
jgi:hypothetical protein